MAKQIGRAVLGLVVGYVTVIALSVGTTTLMRSLFEIARSADPPGWYHAFDFAYSTLAMAVGGYVAAWVGRRSAGVALAVVFLALGVMTAIGGRDPLHPPLYQWSIALLGPALVLAGASLRDRRRQRSPTTDTIDEDRPT